MKDRIGEVDKLGVEVSGKRISGTDFGLTSLLIPLA